MSTEFWALVAAIVIGFVHIILQATSSTMVRSTEWNVGPRDESKPPLSGMPGRFERALRNFLETFPFFAAAILMAQATRVHNDLTVWGAWLYVAARVLYIPLYAYGVSYVRSLAWAAGTLGIALVLFGLPS